MKFRKLALVLVVVLMASTLTPVFAKSPFADVPADHWAYDSVVELAAAGLIEGYPDGTFGGSRMMTRYEAAMVFARALTRLETQIANIDVLPELDKIKAELMEDIKAQLAALDKPVVETKIIEKVIDKDVDEAALARIRATEIATEALEGDIAYVEARVLGLVDGIRFDVNRLQEQLDAEPEVEIPSMEEIEALIAAKVEEGILEAALSAKEVVKETTIVEKAVSTVPEVTEEDVELIAEALIAQQLKKYDIILNETRDHIVTLYTRLDEVEADQADLKAKVKELEKVAFSGNLNFEGKSDSGKDFEFTQKGALNLHVKASDTVDVKAWVNNTIVADELDLDLTGYGVEVTSQGPVKKLSVGKIKNLNIDNGYVLPNANYGFAGHADLNLFEGLTGKVLLGQTDVGGGKPVVAGLGLEYKLMPELGIKVAGAAKKVYNELPEFKAVGAGIFGKVATIGYTGDFALDLTANEKNYLAAVTLNTNLAGVDLDGAFTYKAENYEVIDPFEQAADYSFELGAGVDFIGIDLKGRYYNETGTDLNDETINLVSAYRVDAAKTFDLFLPVTVSARYVSNTTEGKPTAKNNIFAKVGAEQKADLGLRYGASAAYEKNAITDNNWKSYDAFGNKTNATFAANVGYKLDWRTALVDLGYDATFTLPIVEENEPKPASTLKHNVGVGYEFTKDVKLTLGGSVTQTFKDDSVSNAYNYKAGLNINF